MPFPRSTSCSSSLTSLYKLFFWEDPTDRDPKVAAINRIGIEALQSQALSNDFLRNGKPETLQMHRMRPSYLFWFNIQAGYPPTKCSRNVFEQQPTLASSRIWISCLQASIADLSGAKETLELRLQTYKPLIHPVRRLPDDVLSYIFRICVDMDVEERQKKDSSYCQRYPGSLDTRKAPWLLGQICTKWRALSESLPQLWTAVDLDWRYDS
ncbi:hypothetical protein PQX77_019497, partial [Marasmius sp. AFHP31]